MIDGKKMALGAGSGFAFPVVAKMLLEANEVKSPLVSLPAMALSVWLTREATDSKLAYVGGGLALLLMLAGSDELGEDISFSPKVKSFIDDFEIGTSVESIFPVKFDSGLTDDDYDVKIWVGKKDATSSTGESWQEMTIAEFAEFLDYAKHKFGNNFSIFIKYSYEKNNEGKDVRSDTTTLRQERNILDEIDVRNIIFQDEKSNFEVKHVPYERYESWYGKYSPNIPNVMYVTSSLYQPVYLIYRTRELESQEVEKYKDTRYYHSLVVLRQRFIEKWKKWHTSRGLNIPAFP